MSKSSDNRCCIIRDDTTNLVSLTIFINVGSRDEDPKKLGISHYLEHMIFRGGQKYKSNSEVFKKFDSIGAQFNGHTSRDLTWYNSKSSYENLEIMLDIWSDLILNCKLDEKAFNKERNIILREISAIVDNPSAEIWRPFEQMIFGGKCANGEVSYSENGMCLQKSISGDTETLNSITYQDIKDFYKKYYTIENMSLCICGRVGDDVEKLVETYFRKKDFLMKDFRKKDFRKKDFRKKGQMSRYQIKEKWTIKQRKCVLDRKGQEQIIIGFPYFGGFWSNNKVEAQFLKLIIGGLVSSRLFLEIRENRGLVYGVSSDLELYLEGGYYAIKTATKKENVNEVITIILDEIKTICNKGINNEEFDKVKGYLKGRMKIAGEDPGQLGLFYNKQLAYKIDHWKEESIITYDNFLKEVEKTKKIDVEKVAKDLLNLNNMVCVVSGKTKLNDLPQDL